MQYICELEQLKTLGSSVIKAADEVSIFYTPNTTLTIEEHIKLSGMKGKMTYLPVTSKEEELFAIGGIASNIKGGAILILDGIKLSDGLMEKYLLTNYERKGKAAKKPVAVEESEPETAEKEEEPERETKEEIKQKDEGTDDLFGGTSGLFDEASGGDYYSSIGDFAEILGMQAKDYGINIPESMFVSQIAEDIANSDDDTDLQRRIVARFQDKAPRIWTQVKKQLDKLRPLAQSITAE